MATLAGVSTATVSHVLNGSGRVSAATAQRVLRAVAELGYVPKAHARSLATGSSRTVGVVAAAGVPDGEGFAELIAGLARTVGEQGYHLLVLGGPIAPEESRPSAPVASGKGPGLGEMLRSGLVDALVAGAGLDADTTSWVVSAGLPLLTFGPDSKMADVDHAEPARLAARHLADLGHDRIGLVCHASLSPDDQAAATQLEVGGGAALCVQARDLTPEAGADAARLLLLAKDPPTAIICANVGLTDGVLQAASELGIAVPQQLSVVGYGSRWTSRLSPPLTSVSPRWEDFGAEIGKSVLASLAGEAPPRVSLCHQLTVRSSTAPPGCYATPTTLGCGPVFKKGMSFALWSPTLSLDPSSAYSGIYEGDTRMLSLYQARLDGSALRPQSLRHGDGSATANYVYKRAGVTRRLNRRLVFHSNRLEDRWEWQQWGEPDPWTIELSVGADFHDIFEIRDVLVTGHGDLVADQSSRGAHLRYSGRDGVARSVTLEFDRPARSTSGLGWHWNVTGDEPTGALLITTSWRNEAIGPMAASAAQALPWPAIEVSDPAWGALLARSTADLELLATDWGQGRVPMAGLPWFGTLVGRDAIVTALETLEWLPSLARETVDTLAALQGKEVDPDREEEPGKIVHEVRHGELALLGEVPFRRYYGSVDATPLFVTLAAATWRRTGDTAWFQTVMPAVEAALDWILAQRSPRGLYETRSHGSGGLAVQSWRDSPDSMIFANGDHGRPPLAMVEVQGYVYQALREAAQCHRSLGGTARSAELEGRADDLQAAFQEAFWLGDEQYYALAVDDLGRRLDAISSDAGQCLWSGIVPEPRRAAVIERLMSTSMFSGWGMRTLAAVPDGPAYDPYSYHRGSVWPHTTALVAAGLRRAGAGAEAARVAGALVDASAGFEGRRLPELFSGEPRSMGGPFPYPGACSPQAWAAGASLLLLTTVLGLRVDSHSHVIELRPHLPESIGAVEVSGLSLGGAGTVDLTVDRHGARCRRLPASWSIEGAGP